MNEEKLKETMVDYEALGAISNVWEKANRQRYYIRGDSVRKLNPFISKKRDSGRYEVELGNGFLYISKCYNDFPGKIQEVVDLIEGESCIVDSARA